MPKKNPRTNIISMRITDEEFEDLQQLMELRRKKASEIMREGFSLLITDWDRVLRARKSTAGIGSRSGLRGAGTGC